MPKITDFGSQKDAQREPKSDPKPTKIENKNRYEKKRCSRPSWGCLGAILGRFVTALGLIFIDFLLVFKAFREKSLFSKNIVSRPVLSPTWPILDRFWPPKWLQHGSQNESKTIKKSSWILIIFKIDFGSKMNACNSETCAASERKAQL